MAISVQEAREIWHGILKDTFMSSDLPVEPCLCKLQRVRIGRGGQMVQTNKRTGKQDRYFHYLRKHFPALLRIYEKRLEEAVNN